MSRLFISFNESTNSIVDTTAIHARPTGISMLNVAELRARTILTTWVRGSAIMARYCIGRGMSERGKKVPLNRNMGVMNKKVG